MLVAREAAHAEMEGRFGFSDCVKEWQQREGQTRTRTVDEHLHRHLTPQLGPSGVLGRLVEMDSHVEGEALRGEMKFTGAWSRRPVKRVNFDSTSVCDT